MINKTVLDVELNTGEVHAVRITNRSKVAYDLTRPRRKWEPADEAPFIFLTFLAFHHVVMVEQLITCKWEEWVDGICVDIGTHDGADAEAHVLGVYEDALRAADVTDDRDEVHGEPVDPTRQEVESGTSLASL